LTFAGCVPEVSTPLVVRARLLDQLDAAIRSPYTQLRAPAGWGKTVLLSAWARNRTAPGPVVWLTAERTTAAGFEQCLVSGLAEATGTGAAEIEAGALGVAADRITTVVVIDGFDDVTDRLPWHRVESLVRTSRGGVRFLLSCRTDPALPLHRWRVDGTMVEVGAAALSLTLTETAELLHLHGVTLADSALVELHSLTEGWPAGVRLAAMLLREQADPNLGVTELITQDRGINDYLAKEVLAPLPPDHRRLLLETSIVPWMSAGSVEALTGRADGAAVLAELDRRSAFVSHCGRPIRWYRQHPLLATQLHDELLRETPQRVAELHALAARWHRENGQPASAVRHALAAGVWPQAVSVLETSWPDIILGYRRSTRSIGPCQPERAASDPQLALACAAERMDAGDLTGMRSLLRLAEQAEHAVPEAARPPTAMKTGFMVAEARLAGNHRLVCRLAPRLIARPADCGSGPAADSVRAVGLVALGTARLHLGDDRSAEPLLREGLRLAAQTGLGQAHVASLSQLGLSFAARGRLRESMDAGQRALALSHRLGIGDSSDLAWARLAMAEAYLQVNRLSDGQRSVEEAMNQAGVDPAILVAARVQQARMWAAAGSVSAAHAAVAAARADMIGRVVAPPLVAALLLVEAELWVAGGDPAAATRVLNELGDGGPLAGRVAVVRGEILLAEGKPSAAAAMVAGHVDESPDCWSPTTTVRAAILSALAGCAMGDRNRAFHGLRAALRIAAVHGHRSPFVNSWVPLRELMDSYAPGVDVDDGVLAELSAAMDWHPSHRPADADGAQPLTDRERTVLRYLSGTLSNVEIAVSLCVSVNTVKTHVKNVYRKLGTGRRREAVRRARELRLI